MIKNTVAADKALVSSTADLNELKELLEYWQRELRLDHWDINLRWAAPGEIPTAAGTSIAGRYHQATILLQYPGDRAVRDLADVGLGYELTLVHELRHIQESIWRDNPKIEAVMDNDPWIQRWHEAIHDATAEALVRARRGLRRL